MPNQVKLEKDLNTPYTSLNYKPCVLIEGQHAIPDDGTVKLAAVLTQDGIGYKNRPYLQLGVDTDCFEVVFETPETVRFYEPNDVLDMIEGLAQACWHQLGEVDRHFGTNEREKIYGELMARISF